MEQVGPDSLVFVVPRDEAGQEKTGKAHMQGTQISVDASSTLSKTAGQRPTHAGSLVGLLTSIKLRVEQQQRSLLLRILVSDTHAGCDSADISFDVRYQMGW